MLLMNTTSFESDDEYATMVVADDDRSKLLHGLEHSGMDYKPINSLVAFSQIDGVTQNSMVMGLRVWKNKKGLSTATKETSRVLQNAPEHYQAVCT